MSKQQLKRKAYQDQNGYCNLSNVKLTLNKASYKKKSKPHSKSEFIIIYCRIS